MSVYSSLIQNKITYFILGVLIALVFHSLFLRDDHEHAGQEINEAVSSATTWTCSMHPQIQQPEAGDCPICGMDLIPLSSTGEESGPRILTMSEVAKKLAEIQTVPVKRAYVEHELRLVGKVEYDETKLKYISAWYPGRLERLYVDSTGTPVEKGDHLVEIYSPAILTDQEALLQAKQAAAQTRQNANGQYTVNRQQTLERARNRLRLLGLTETQIQEIEERGAPTERINFYSPIDGIVIHKNALEGDYVDTGNRIYTIADLSEVWVKLDAYESDLPWVHYGQEVEFTTVSHPGEVFKGRISFIDPFLNEKTRTVKVRVNVNNEDRKLKPEMFVRAVVSSKVNAAGEIYDTMLAGKWISPMHPEIIKDEPGTCDICGMPLVKAEELGFVDADDTEHKPPLVIPSSAPLITGKRAVVYVQLPDTEKPTFEGREVVLGPRLKDHYIVESGVGEGEEVVVNGNFKIDSALQIEAKPSMMNPTGGSTGSAGSSTSKGAGSSTSKDAGSVSSKQMPSAEAAGNQSVKPDAPFPISANVLPRLLDPYRSIQTALAQDDLSAAQEASREWISAAQTSQLSELENIGLQIKNAESIDKAREVFHTLSNAMIAALEEHGTPEQPVYQIHCPMAFNNQGASWLQWQHETRNPYFGDLMLTCGVLEKTFEPDTTVEAKETQPR